MRNVPSVRKSTIKKLSESLPKDGHTHNRNLDKIWCPERSHYQYVEACDATCRKKKRCQAYAGYREPKLIW